MGSNSSLGCLEDLKENSFSSACKIKILIKPINKYASLAMSPLLLRESD